MAVPNTTTYSITNVKTELCITESSSLTAIFAEAPNITYDPAYKGTETCLLNFRNYKLISINTGFVGMSYGAASDGTNMWFPHYSTSNVTKLAPDGSKTVYGPVGTNPLGIAFDGTNMWTVNRTGNNVSKITPSGTITSYSLPAGSMPASIAFDGTNMWTGNNGNNTVSKITPTGTVTNYPIDAVYPQTIAYDGANMWVAGTSPNYGSITKVTSSGSYTRYDYPSIGGGGIYPTQMVFDGTNMWTANEGQAGVSKITPSGAITNYNGIITAMGQPADVYGIGFDGTYIWLSDKCWNGRVAKICTANGVKKRLYCNAGCGIFKMGFDGSRMWMSNVNGGCVTSIGAI
jgi:hypothetical protein